MSIFMLLSPQTTLLLAQAHAATQPAADPVLSQTTLPASTFGAVEMIILLWSLAALIWVIRRVFLRPASVLGPLRIRTRQDISMLIISFAAGMLAWLLLQVWIEERLLTKLKHAGVAHPDQQLQAHMKPGDLALLSTVPSLVGFVVMILLLTAFAPGILHRLGLNLRNLGRGIWAGLLALVIVFPLILWTGGIVEKVYEHFHYHHEDAHEMLEGLGQSGKSGQTGNELLLILGATFCAPFFEELLFRGHVQTLLRRFFVSCSEWWSPTTPLPENGKPWHAWMAILLTSTMFALVHPPWMAPLIFVLALGLGFIYERTGTLWACITMHCLFNSTETLQYYLIYMRH
jgi:membrane protease YdiL (CAAX protease family)